MLTVVWSNPSKLQRDTHTIERQRGRGRGTFLVNGTDVWIVFSQKPKYNRIAECKAAGGC